MIRTQIFNAAEMSVADLQPVARAMTQGAVAVLPTDTVYGLATSAFCESGIEKIYRLKNRPSGQPLQLLMSGAEQVRNVAKFSPGAEKLARAYWPGALTLILPAVPAGEPLLRGALGLGIRVPGMQFLQRLLACVNGPLACTSANEHGQAVFTREEDLVECFDGKVDFIIKGGTLSPTASSVVDLTQTPRLLREGAISKAALENVLGGTIV